MIFVYVLVQLYSGIANVAAFKTADACLQEQSKRPGNTKCLKLEVRRK